MATLASNSVFHSKDKTIVNRNNIIVITKYDNTAATEMFYMFENKSKNAIIIFIK